MKSAAIALSKITAQEIVTPTNRAELFNGTNFDGFTFCMRDDADPVKTWSVANGFVGIQSEGADFEIRKIYLEPLK